MVTALTVNDNTPSHLERLLSSFRKFYPDVPFLVIDESSDDVYKKIKNFSDKFKVTIQHIEFDIHQSSGLAYGASLIKTDQILICNSDMIIHNGGWLEIMERELRKNSYGIGHISKEFYQIIREKKTVVAAHSVRNSLRIRNKVVNGRKGIVESGLFDYLHSGFVLVNNSVMSHYPDPIRGEFPLLPAMRMIHSEGKGGVLLQRLEWLEDDLYKNKKRYIERDSEYYSEVINGQKINSNIKGITALTVNYNTPDLLKRLLSSFRRFYDIPYVVIDGSEERYYEKIKDFPKEFNIKLIHFNYNIHHGPGLAYGIKQITTPQILMVDSDMIILNGGWLEEMKKVVQPHDYGTGDIQAGNGQQGYIAEYMHPVLALINRDVALRYPLPDKSGMPLFNAMYQLKREGNLKLLKRSQWLTDDLWKHLGQYVQHGSDHEGMSTVRETGGYHY